MHRKTGYLNYLSNSNFDYNNQMNSRRRFGAYAGLEYKPNLAGIVIGEMGGIGEMAKSQVEESPFLWAGIGLIALPHAKKQFTKKKMSKKSEKSFLYAGLGSIAWHYLKPMMMGE